VLLFLTIPLLLADTLYFTLLRFFHLLFIATTVGFTNATFSFGIFCNMERLNFLSNM